ncbi:MAG: penicillin-binding protein 2 [Elusimicrobia bacterium]|nr:penicillin-binding protein 2 [Elusimicrobiota bacterium]
MIASTRARLNVCAALAAFPIVPLAVRLAQLQVLEHGRLAAMATGEVRRSEVEVVPRGRILDRNGNVLAESIPASSAFLDPAAARGRERDLPKLAAALRADPAELRRKARGNGRFVWLKRKLEPQEVDAIKELDLPFVGLVPDERRVYPNAELATSLLGAVGIDGKGLSGLELTHDRDLVGRVHKIPVLRDGAGNRMPLAARQTIEAPPDLVLTVDRGLQHYAEAALEEAIAKFQPQWAAAVVQDPISGELLALASLPVDAEKNRIFQQVYEPGSTFKTVTVAGALEERLASPSEAIDCSGPWELASGVFVKDHDPLGVLPLDMALARSSNVGMAKLGLKLGPERFHRYARAFGFGARTALRFPGESAGILKQKPAKDRVSLGNNAFGQGLAVTPLQLVASYSAIANGGRLVEPRLVRGVGRGLDFPVEPQPVRRVASAKTIAALGRMLELVVEKGTGLSAAVPGYSVAGKTGTSQKIDPATRRYSTTDYIASFAGYVPAREPRFTILVVIDSPKHQYYGAEVAAPVFAKIARQALALYGVPPDKPLPVRVVKK